MNCHVLSVSMCVLQNTLTDRHTDGSGATESERGCNGPEMMLSPFRHGAAHES